MIDVAQAPTPETAERDTRLLRTMGIRRRIIPGTCHQRIMARDDYRCAYCGLDMLGSLDALLNSSIDHVVPRSAAGTNDPANLVACCTTCNHLKGKVPVFSVCEGAMIINRHRAALIPLLQERMADIGFEFLRQTEAPLPARRFAAAANVLAGQVEGIRRAVETINRFAETMEGG